ncbi:glutathione S-transferase family protein [Brucella sp. JSBI001]|uniref:glutathione S-transferase family protein n=1 Tax=Brucella sp. JSBI001 TaxID=2886044 RepID=UPI00223053D6|nr:glutathione S-transferase family protein [Brucella sp. JSBI001]UZD69377.1 glutathione S-transferase family protein [Brucella sp. JSBI001]
MPTSEHREQTPMIVWTYDWVPGGEDGPRGYVRDLRLRWALEEAGLDYAVRSVSFEERGPDHIARQPFAQVPFLEDDGVTIFESGACLLHLARKSEALMPRDAQGGAETLEWVIAGLNSIEIVTVPWWFLSVSGDPENGLKDWASKRLDQIETVLADREWLAASRFTVDDILMADVLRLPELRKLGDRPATAAYVERVCARPAFEKARNDQIAHFAKGDETRKDMAS